MSSFITMPEDDDGFPSEERPRVEKEDYSSLVELEQANDDVLTSAMKENRSSQAEETKSDHQQRENEVTVVQEEIKHQHPMEQPVDEQIITDLTAPPAPQEDLVQEKEGPGQDKETSVSGLARLEKEIVGSSLADFDHKEKWMDPVDETANLEVADNPSTTDKTEELHIDYANPGEDVASDTPCHVETELPPVLNDESAPTETSHEQSYEQDGQGENSSAAKDAPTIPIEASQNPPTAGATESAKAVATVDAKEQDADPWSAKLSDYGDEERSPHSDDVPLQDTMGAKLLLNRFSSWRQKANEAVTQHTQALQQSQQFQQFRQRAQAALKTTPRKEPSEEGTQPSQHEQPVIREEKASVAKDSTTSEDAHIAEEGNEGEQEREADERTEHTSNVDSLEQQQDSPIPSHPIVDDYGETTEDDSRSYVTDDYTNSDYYTTDYSESVSTDDAGLRSAAAALYARAAASVVADSVATSFRGRYGGDALTKQRQEENDQKKVSQTAKILSSRAAAHMQSILDRLDESHEYVMLLGSGMLGVNLRQTYLKNHGVYVDYLVEGGSAYHSGVVFPGDVIQKVGSVDVRKGTILTVPKTIADAKRPVVLAFTTGQKVETSKFNYVDLSIAMMHQVQQENRRGISRMPLHDPDQIMRRGDEEEKKRSDDDSPVEVCETNDSTEASDTNDNWSPRKDKLEEKSLSPQTTSLRWTIPPHSLDAINPANVPPPPSEAKEALKAHLARRGNGNVLALDEMTHAAARTDMENFRTSLRHAFVTCALDGRRLPFLSRHFATLNSQSEDHSDVQKTTPSTELMLFLELTSFVELYGATPRSRRHNIAKRIAYKFFLTSTIGSRTEMPMFDFSHLCPEVELINLQEVVSDCDSDQRKVIQRNAFLPFQEAVVERLSGAPFISFLLSDECGRMRGYLRDTAPYRTVSPGDFFYHAVASEHDDHAANHLLYNLLFLLCQREREVCGENDDIVGEKTNRVIGAAGGVCCAMFIKKTLSSTIEAAENELDEDAPLSSHIFKNLTSTYEKLWDMFISPHGGALELLSISSETDAELALVRQKLNMARIEKSTRKRYELLTSSELSRALQHVADNLVYDYSVNGYTKFREHPFHEWMCSEVNSAWQDGEEEVDSRIPRLPHGCIARLLRRAELPKGISAHKPTKLPEDSISVDCHTEKVASNRNFYPNAHYALVFGTDDGSAIMDRSSNPALSQFDIRRYTCQKVVLEEEAFEIPSKLCRIQPTIESYAIAPSLRQSPFPRMENSARISSDGWEVSLIDFMIPGSDAERSQEGATYGVSLVFQKREGALLNSTEETRPGLVPLKLVFEQTPKKRSQEDTEESRHTGSPQDDAATLLTDDGPKSPFATANENAETSERPISPFAGGGIAAAAALAAASRNKKAEEADDGELASPVIYSSIAALDREVGVRIASDEHPPATPNIPGKDEVAFDTKKGEAIDLNAFSSPLSVFSQSCLAVGNKESSFDEISRILRVETETPVFNRRMTGKPWVERVKKQRSILSTGSPVTIGLVLVSSDSVIFAMRDTLSRLLGDFSKTQNGQLSGSSIICQPLIDLLGNFAYTDVEPDSLQSILRPYLRFASSPWLRQPRGSQQLEYVIESGQRLIDSLPLIPLALLYITVLLEQKVVFSSSRRSVLVSAATAITSLLDPFKWEHLLVPLVPSSLANDLLEYPAPFIIGLASEDEGNLELLNSLPDDVTLVDLDVGRVILAPTIAFNEDALRDPSSDRRSIGPALRSQILYLAQALGIVFGSKLSTQAWCSDSPHPALCKKDKDNRSQFEQMQDICRSFLNELLTGIQSCSYWIEEHQPADTEKSVVESAVLFDEDRFFHLKNLRAGGKHERLFEEETKGIGELALSVDDFDLVLECLLRCQSMSTYISCQPKDCMAFF